MRENDVDDDSHSLPPSVDRRSNRRSVMRWTPDISAGTVALIITTSGSIAGLYAALSSDNAKRDEKIATVQRDREEDRKQFSGALQDIKSEIRETTRAVNSTKEDVATMKAQLGVMQAAPPPPRSSR